jgi:hypothetical protein
MGDTIHGVIGNVIGGVGDRDYYVFSAQGGAVLRVTVTPRDMADFRPGFSVHEPTMGYARVGRVATGTTAASRQVYLPEAGNYVVVVYDERNGATANVGGAAIKYEVTLVVEALAPVAVTPPFQGQAGTIPTNGAIPSYSFTLTAGQGVRAETRADRLTPASNVDTVLCIVELTTPPTALGCIDDISMSTVDSLVRAVTRNAGAHAAVVDYFDLNGAARNFELSVEFFDSAAEVEPNNLFSQATPFPGAQLPIRGTIDDDEGGGQGGDYDLFSIPAVAGQYLEITVDKAADADAAFVPAVWFVNPQGQFLFGNSNLPASPSARLEAYAFVSGTHFVYVADRRNEIDHTGEFFGGSTYKYSVQYKEIPRNVNALTGFPVITSGSSPNTAAEAITMPGKSAWFTFTVPAGVAKLGWIDLDLRGVGSPSVDGYELRPRMSLVGPDGVTFWQDDHVIMFRNSILEPGTYTLIVSDHTGSSSATHHGFRPRVVTAGDMVSVTDDGTHHTRQTALAMGTLPARSQSALTAGGQNWYALGTLAQGTRLTALTAAVGGSEVDTILTIYGADGTTVIEENDDITASNRFSRVSGVLLPTAQAYYARVTGYQNAAGNYQFLAVTGLCAGSASAPVGGDVFINEFFPAPVTPGGDANQDSTVDATQDEFVEVVNFSAAQVDVSGIIIRDAFGMRARAACDTVLPAGGPMVVFGGCTPGSPVCQVLPVANADAENPASTTGTQFGLSLDNAGDHLMLVGPHGEILDRLTYSSVTNNVSYARGVAGVCDAPPVGGAIQLHTACTNPASAGPYSPMQRANRTNFP